MFNSYVKLPKGKYQLTVNHLETYSCISMYLCVFFVRKKTTDPAVASEVRLGYDDWCDLYHELRSMGMQNLMMDKCHGFQNPIPHHNHHHHYHHRYISYIYISISLTYHMVNIMASDILMASKYDILNMMI